MNVLFVCTANICRSAYAELMTRHVLGPTSQVEVASAGTHGYVDHPIDPPMGDQLRDRGVVPDDFRSRRLTMRMVDQADLVLTAEVAHRQLVLEERPEAFRRVYTLGQLVRALDEAGDGAADLDGPELLGAVRSVVRPAEPVDDVVDPYRRGEEAAAQAAARLDDLVHRIAPLLLSR